MQKILWHVRQRFDPAPTKIRREATVRSLDYFTQPGARVALEGEALVQRAPSTLLGPFRCQLAVAHCPS